MTLLIDRVPSTPEPYPGQTALIRRASTLIIKKPSGISCDFLSFIIYIPPTSRSWLHLQVVCRPLFPLVIVIRRTPPADNFHQDHQVIKSILCNTTTSDQRGLAPFSSSSSIITTSNQRGLAQQQKIYLNNIILSSKSISFSWERIKFAWLPLEKPGSQDSRIISESSWRIDELVRAKPVYASVLSLSLNS